MSVSVVWVDRDLAKIFHFSEDRMERESLMAPRGEGADWRELYADIAEKLCGKKRILLLGSEVARVRLFHFLQDRFPEISHQIVGCETVEHPTDPLIAALALKYIHKVPGR